MKADVRPSLLEGQSKDQILPLGQITETELYELNKMSNRIS